MNHLSALAIAGSDWESRRAGGPSDPKGAIPLGRQSDKVSQELTVLAAARGSYSDLAGLNVLKRIKLALLQVKGGLGSLC